jgi:hypothetical protein
MYESQRRQEKLSANTMSYIIIIKYTTNLNDYL